VLPLATRTNRRARRSRRRKANPDPNPTQGRTLSRTSSIQFVRATAGKDGLQSKFTKAKETLARTGIHKDHIWQALRRDLPRLRHAPFTRSDIHTPNTTSYHHAWRAQSIFLRKSRIHSACTTSGSCTSSSTEYLCFYHTSCKGVAHYPTTAHAHHATTAHSSESSRTLIDGRPIRTILP